MVFQNKVVQYGYGNRLTGCFCSLPKQILVLILTMVMSVMIQHYQFILLFTQLISVVQEKNTITFVLRLSESQL